MKVLLIGGGGREHAIAWKLSQSPTLSKLFAAPGNPGIARHADCVPIDVMEFDKIERFVGREKIDLVVIGPEDPLAAGLADRLAKKGVFVFGPSAEAAQLEADKWFTKEIMRHQAIPTAEARSFTDFQFAEEYLNMRDGPFVVKAAGLAKGKGVSICFRAADAVEATRKLLKDRIFGEAGARVVIEEFLTGPEVSVLAFVEGQNIYVMETAQDHKPIDDGDTGPMTGGMGAYSPTPMITSDQLRQVERDIFIPILDGLKRENIHYSGVLYAGLMMTAAGPKVLEFNCRFGDPETQPLMMRLRSDLLPVLLAVAQGKLDTIELDWDPRPAIGVVATSKGYPGEYRQGLPISGLDQFNDRSDLQIFHGGTASKDNQIVTAGGRVLTATALGETLADARDTAMNALKAIHFDGMHFRKDIAERALKSAR